MSHPRSKFDTVKITDRVVYLVDLNGPVTITNDAENVYQFMKHQLPNHKVVYQGTDGEWFEILPVITWMGESIGFKPWNGEAWDILSS
jgi:hypothetical protein